MPGFLSRASSHDVEGVVARVGPWLGPGKLNGIVLALEGHAKPYVILRGDQASTYPAGLTQPGDRVSMRVRPAPEFYTVHLTDFRNQSLESTMRLVAPDGLPLSKSNRVAPPGIDGQSTDEAPIAAVTNVRRLRLVQNADA